MAASFRLEKYMIYIYDIYRIYIYDIYIYDIYIWYIYMIYINDILYIYDIYIYIYDIYIRNGWPYNIMTMLWPEYNRDIGRIVIPSPDRDFQPHVFGPGPKTMVFQSPTKNHGFWRVFKMNGARLDLPWFTWLASRLNLWWCTSLIQSLQNSSIVS